MACDFLDQIHLARHIHSASRNDHIPGGRLTGVTEREAKTLEDALHVRVGHRRAKKSCDFVPPQPQRPWLNPRGIAIHDRASTAACTDSVEQRTRSLHRRDRKTRVRAALEPDAGFGLQPELAA